MAQQPASQGIRVSLGGVCASQRFMIVMNFLKASALSIAQDGLRVAGYFETTVYPAWKDCFASDCYLDGLKVESMCRGNLIPVRRLYGPLEYVGAISGESYSPNASMLGVWYSADVATAFGETTSVAKNFLGPPPESKCAADSLDLSFAQSEVLSLLLLLTTFTTNSGADHWKRAMKWRNVPMDPIWEATTPYARSSIFTQKRRVMPVL